MPNILTRDPVTGRIVRSSGKLPGEVMKPAAVAKRAAVTMITKELKRGGRNKVDLSEMADMAHDVLRMHLKANSPIVAMWLLEKGLDKGHLATPIEGVDLNNIESVIEAGRRTSLQALAGDLPLAQAQRVITMLHDYAKLRMTDEVAKLEALLKQIEEAASERKKVAVVSTEQVLSQDQLPSWGNLRKGEENGHEEDDGAGNSELAPVQGSGRGDG